MKKMYKFFSLAVAAVMAFCLCSFGVIFEASADYTITLKKPNSSYSFEGHVYNAYKVFNVKVNDEKDSYIYTITSDCIGYGTTNVNDANGYVNGSTVYDSTTIASANVREFAEFLNTTFFPSGIYSGNNGKATFAGNAPDADGNIVINVGTNAGYYLITDTYSGSTSVTSLVMLDTAANQEAGHPNASGANVDINVKAGTPVSLVKEVKVDDYTEPNNDDTTAPTTDTWGLYTDCETSTELEFRLKAKVPNFDFDQYSSYTFNVVDTLPASLTYVTGSAKVFKNSTFTDANVIAAASLKADWASLSNQTLTFSFTGSASDNGSLIKLVNDSVLSKDQEFYIYYKATLNGNAAYAASDADDDKENQNSAYVEYLTSPYGTASTQTASAIARVWTYGTDIIKYKQSSDTSHTYTDADLLTGAKFKIYRDSKNDANLLKFTAKDGKYYVDSNGSVTELEVGAADAAKGKLVIYGLNDLTTYVIEESTIPDGYVSQSDTTLIINTSFNESGDTIESFARTIGGNVISASGDNVQILNSTGGSELIGTGGIGTTIFYVAGGILMVGAAILLLTKLRMRNKD